MKSFSVLSGVLCLASTLIATAIPNVGCITDTPSITNKTSTTNTPSGPVSPAIDTDRNLRSSSCFITFEIYYSLEQFKLDLKTQEEIDSTPPDDFDRIIKPLTYQSDLIGGSGSFTPWVGEFGTDYPLIMDDGIIKLMIPEKIASPLAYIDVPRDEAIYSQIKFKSVPKIATTFFAKRACKPGIAWLELFTSEENNVFCTVNNQLYLKHQATPDSVCTEVHPIIHILPKTE